ncbi:MAG: ribonuclease Z [Anaerolineae bacterium]|nr:ribonuclease Z [Caldilineales bacterium]MCX7852885.1 ribonuclease Z [Caldilineales bacterium]MDW8268506.1 ribonuclease Z [Anaerolineae bacterium]
MFELIFLGTSASAPSVQRGLSSAVLSFRNHRFLIDCGEGTQRQLLIAGLGFKRLDKILITHAHLDHILGLGGLVSTMARWELMERIDIYAGGFALDRIRRLFGVVFGPGELPMHIEWHRLEPGVFFADEHLEIEAFPVEHRGPDCFGFLFRERSRRPFLVEAAEALGVPFGPERRRLVNGESVTLADGRVIHPDDVLGPPVSGTRLAFIGDLARTRHLVDTVRGVDALVVEATYLEEDREIAQRFGHLTAAEAARLAQRAEVGLLILTHLSRRYHTHQVLDEARTIFPNTVVANDFDRFTIKRSESTTFSETDK